MAIHSSILAWRIPWTEKPGGLQCEMSIKAVWRWQSGLPGIRDRRSWDSRGKPQQRRSCLGTTNKAIAGCQEQGQCTEVLCLPPDLSRPTLMTIGREGKFLCPCRRPVTGAAVLTVTSRLGSALGLIHADSPPLAAACLVAWPCKGSNRRSRVGDSPPGPTWRRWVHRAQPPLRVQHWAREASHV